MGLDTKFVFLGWPKAKICAIQFSEDFDGGHFEKCLKRWGRPNLYGVNISIIDQWGPLNKMIPLIEDPGGGGGGGARWPLWAHGLFNILRRNYMFRFICRLQQCNNSLIINLFMHRQFFVLPSVTEWYRTLYSWGCDQIMGVGFTLLDLFPDITDHISSIWVRQWLLIIANMCTRGTLGKANTAWT